MACDDASGESSKESHTDIERSPPNLKPTVNKDDSGESSNADKWFDKSNNDVPDQDVVDSKHWLTAMYAVASYSCHSDDPPFFLQHSSSEDKSPPLGQRVTQLNAQNLNSIPMISGDGASSNDDYRSVIDDLTIQNKKLKRRLKRYEMLQDAHLNEEKLFEVRVHGLPASKKQQLEEILRKFTLGLQQDQASSSVDNTGVSTSTLTSNARTQAGPGLLRPHASSKSSQFNDSAYASGSGSVQASLNHPGYGHGFHNHHAKPSARSNEQSIHSYLNEIPAGLLPQHTANLSERAKKKLVVRRLEQIFSGRGADAGGHQQPIQQQEVSQLAAQDDRNARTASGRGLRTEGNREARIMRNDPEDPQDMEISTDQNVASDKDCTNKSSLTTNLMHKPAEIDFAAKSPSGRSPDQRPTRPLDLDPQRAQFPAENIEYIRHLGFSPPDAHSERSPEEGHGWIYLNLLMNMAQLHTINVTTDFVKKALQDYSTRFELSSDGRKVRWRRNHGITRTSSDLMSVDSSDSPIGQSPRKRLKTFHEQGDRNGENKLFYTPLLFRNNNSSTMTSSSEDDPNDSPDRPWAGMPNAGSRVINADGRMEQSSNYKRRQNGPIIFYNNARFCTDLSGDVKTEATMGINPIKYYVTTPQPVGGGKETDSESGSDERKGLLNDAKDLPEPMDLADNPIPAAMELGFPPQTPMTSGSERSPFDMEVSGLGGIYPADNFAINVRTKHAHTDIGAPETIRNRVPGKYPDNLAGLLMKDPKSKYRRSAFHKEVVSTKRRDLSPSELPPASCYIPLEDSDSEDELYDSFMSPIPDDTDDAPPHAAPQPIKMDSWGSESGAESDSEDNDEDDDAASEASLDLLATAREIDPEAVRARERDYDAAMAERLAEEIPAGSSAATFGGGSGFGSPVSEEGSESG